MLQFVTKKLPKLKIHLSVIGHIRILAPPPWPMPPSDIRPILSGRNALLSGS